MSLSVFKRSRMSVESVIKTGNRRRSAATSLDFTALTVLCMRGLEASELDTACCHFDGTYKECKREII